MVGWVIVDWLVTVGWFVGDWLYGHFEAGNAAGWLAGWLVGWLVGLYGYAGGDIHTESITDGASTQ